MTSDPIDRLRARMEGGGEAKPASDLELLQTVQSVRPPEVRDRRLGELLIEMGALSQNELDEALRLQTELGFPLGHLVLQTGSVTWSQVKLALRNQRMIRQSLDPAGSTAGEDAAERPTKAPPLLTLVRDDLLGEILVRSQALERSQLDDALRAQRSSGRRLGEELMEAGVVDWPTIRAALEKQHALRSRSYRKGA